MKNDPNMTEELMAAVRDAFGPCAALYECHTVAELLKFYADDEDDLAGWLNTQMRVEDAFGTSIALIAEIEERLTQLLAERELPPLERPRKYRSLLAELKEEMRAKSTDVVFEGEW